MALRSALAHFGTYTYDAQSKTMTIPKSKRQDQVSVSSRSAVAALSFSRLDQKPHLRRPSFANFY